LYRWTGEWGINLVSQTGAGHASLKIQKFKAMGNWVLGGFVMGIVNGIVQYKEKEYAASGFVEIIM